MLTSNSPLADGHTSSPTSASVAQGKQLITIKELKEILRIESATTVYERIKCGLLPEPVHVNRRSFWPVDELNLIIGAIAAGADTETQTRLVATIMTDRELRLRHLQQGLQAKRMMDDSTSNLVRHQREIQNQPYL